MTLQEAIQALVTARRERDQAAARVGPAHVAWENARYEARRAELVYSDAQMALLALVEETAAEPAAA